MEKHVAHKHQMQILQRANLAANAINCKPMRDLEDTYFRALDHTENATYGTVTSFRCASLQKQGDRPCIIAR